MSQQNFEEKLDPNDVFFKAADVLLEHMMVVAKMPLDDFYELWEDGIEVFIASQLVLLNTIPDKPHRQSPEQKFFLDALEKFLIIVGKKGGTDIYDHPRF